MLRDLLATWENWSARESLTRAMGRAATEQTRRMLTRTLADTPAVEPLEALRDNTELVSLLAGWRWQAVHAARRDGASWEQIGQATGTTADAAYADHVAAIGRQERARDQLP